MNRLVIYTNKEANMASLYAIFVSFFAHATRLNMTIANNTTSSFKCKFLEIF